MHTSALNIFLGLAGLAGLHVINLYSYLLFHSLAEMFSVAVAWATFFLAWNARMHMKRGHLLFLGTAFLYMGLVDLLHTLAYKGMGVFPEYGPNLPTQLWIAARYLQAGAFLALPFLLKKHVGDKRLHVLFGAVTAALLAAVFKGAFPDCFVEGQGLTLFKKASEYVICLAFISSGGLLWQRRDELSPHVLRLILASLACTVLSELAFTFYVSVYGISNVVGHFAKVVASVFMYKAIVETGLTHPYELLFRDLSRSRAALALSEAGLNTAQALAGVGSFERDAVSNHVRWSDEMFRLLGYEPGQQEPSLELFAEHIHPEDQIRFAEAYQAALGGTGALDIELRYFPVGQDVRHAHLKAKFQYTASGEHAHTRGTVQDITERKQADQLREDVERMIRHDLRSPANSIISGARLLKGSDNLTPSQLDYVDALEKNGFRMLDMINISLNMYLMELGRYELQAGPVDILRVLDLILSEKAKGYGGIPVSILVDNAPPPPNGRFLALGEELLCHSLLANLIRNAMEASPPGETVTIHLLSGNPIEVRIHNKGAVPREVRATFFDKYATAGKRLGTGLGTYSAKLMAETMDGEVAMATSETDGATTVTVRLPAA